MPLHLAALLAGITILSPVAVSAQNTATGKSPRASQIEQAQPTPKVQKVPQGQEAPEAKPASEWALTCDSAKRCEMGISLSDQKGTVSRLLVYKVGERQLLEYLVPLRVNLQKGVKIMIDRKTSFETKPLYCDAPGCIGYTALNSSLLSAMRAGQTLELLFQGINERQIYALPFTLKGFTAVEKSKQAQSAL